ncbi:CRPV-021 [Crowpox virus]|nr:CRPV-021 [Crowpox virus]
MDIVVNLDKIQDSINTRLAALNGISAIVEKENHINKIIDKFVYVGGFQNYMLLISIYYNYSQIENSLIYKSQNILEYAVSKRELYISSHEA